MNYLTAYRKAGWMSDVEKGLSDTAEIGAEFIEIGAAKTRSRAGS